MQLISEKSSAYKERLVSSEAIVVSLEPIEGTAGIAYFKAGYPATAWIVSHSRIKDLVVNQKGKLFYCSTNSYGFFHFRPEEPVKKTVEEKKEVVVDAPKSSREEVQDKLVDFLMEHKAMFNAPYGVLTGFRSWGKGKVRIVTFGIAAYLDCTVFLYGVDNIQVRGGGPLYYKLKDYYIDIEDLITGLKTEFLE